MTNLHDLIDALRVGKVWEPRFKRSMNEFNPQRAWLLATAKNAVCFDMGDVEGVPDLKIIPALFRIPYPVTWLEGKNRDGLLGVLACEVAEGVLHVAVLNKRLMLAWQLVGVVEVFEEKEDIRTSRVAMLSEDEAMNESNHHYANAAVGLMAKFVMALNCINTKRVEHPAPKLINAKRTAKGRQPLFSYWTLHLPASVVNDGSPLGGHHASPRLHLRRGHIRQYAPGKYTWIQACIVGDKRAGMVAKDYALGD